MVIKVVELGPFGCRIDRGTAENLENIPEGYEVKRIKTSPDTVTVYIEPDPPPTLSESPAITPQGCYTGGEDELCRTAVACMCWA